MLNNQNPATSSVCVNKNELETLFDNLKELALDARTTAENAMSGAENIARASQNFAKIASEVQQIICQILFAKDALLLSQNSETNDASNIYY